MTGNSVLFWGDPGSGNTALATKMACDAKFPVTKICSQSDMIRYSESAKCKHVEQLFGEAYKSELSCVVLDKAEKLIGKLKDFDT